MNIYIKDIGEVDCACDALILPVTEGDSGFYGNLGSTISKLIKKLFSKEFRGKQNEVLLVPAPEDIKPERILLVGLDKKDGISDEKVRQAGGKAAVYLRDMGMKRIALSSRVLSSLKMSPADFIEGSLLGLYTFKRYVEEKGNKAIDGLVILSKGFKRIKDDIHWIRTVASSVCFTRDLVNTPSNDMTPSHLANAALSLKRNNLLVKVLEKKDAEKLGMGAYLSVARGSNEPPKFIVSSLQGLKSLINNHSVRHIFIPILLTFL